MVSSKPDPRSSLSLALLLLLLSLEVLVAEVGRSTTDNNEGVDTEAEAGGVARVRGGDGTGLGCLGGWVAGLSHVISLASRYQRWGS